MKIKFASLLLASSLILAACGSEDEKTTEVKENQEETTTETPVAVTEETSLDWDQADFENRFNSFIAENQLAITPLAGQIEEGEVQNTLSYDLTPHSSMVAMVNKDTSKIKDIMMIGAGDGSEDSGLNIMVSLGSLIAAADPTLSAQDRGAIMKELGFGDETKDLMNLKEETSRNGIKYKMSSSEITGFILGVTKNN